MRGRGEHRGVASQNPVPGPVHLGILTRRNDRSERRGAAGSPFTLDPMSDRVAAQVQRSGADPLMSPARASVPGRAPGTRRPLVSPRARRLTAWTGVLLTLVVAGAWFWLFSVPGGCTSWWLCRSWPTPSEHRSSLRGASCCGRSTGRASTLHARSLRWQWSRSWRASCWAAGRTSVSVRDSLSSVTGSMRRCR